MPAGFGTILLQCNKTVVYWPRDLVGALGSGSKKPKPEVIQMFNELKNDARPSLVERVRRIRRALGLLTESEARLDYLDWAQDRIDLEMRMRELDRPARTISHLGSWHAAR
jgi:hypothetical protein